MTACAVAAGASHAQAPGGAAFAGCVQPEGPVTRPAYCSYPVDVRAFLDGRDLCDHFRSEPWPETGSRADRERRAQLASDMEASCTGTDHRLGTLKHRYRNDVAVTAVLSEFEPAVEGAIDP